MSSNIGRASDRPRPSRALVVAAHGRRFASAAALLAFAVGCASPAEHGKHSHPGPHNHHGHHRFKDPEKWAERFENPSRMEWQKPSAVLELLQLRPEMHVANIGSATGYFSVRIAREVPKGRVWGIDIEPTMVQYLNDRAREEGIDNLFSVLGTPSSPLLPEPVDLILLVDTYHHIRDRSEYFGALRDRLKADGRLVIIDFKPGDLPVGPPDTMKLSPAEVETELEAAGYALTHEEQERLPYQYVLVFEAESSASPEKSATAADTQLEPQ